MWLFVRRIYFLITCKTPDAIVLYKDGLQDAVKASVWKSYLEAMTSRVTEQNVTVKDSGGLVIGLPEPYEETEE